MVEHHENLVRFQDEPTWSQTGRDVACVSEPEMSKKVHNRRIKKGFRRGDRVTWGNGSVVYVIKRVVADGVHVLEPDGREMHVRFSWTAYRMHYELRHA